MSLITSHLRNFSDQDRGKIANLLIVVQQDTDTLARLLRFDEALAKEFDISKRAWSHLKQIKARSYAEFIDQYTDLLFDDAFV